MAGIKCITGNFFDEYTITREDENVPIMAAGEVIGYISAVDIVPGDETAIINFVIFDHNVQYNIDNNGKLESIDVNCKPDALTGLLGGVV